MTPTILLAALAITPLEQLQIAFDTYENCLKAQAVVIGVYNHEAAGDVLRAARSKCSSDWQNVQRYYVSDDQRILREFQTTVEDGAVAALLDARRATKLKR